MKKKKTLCAADVRHMIKHLKLRHCLHETDKGRLIVKHLLPISYYTTIVLEPR